MTTDQPTDSGTPRLPGAEAMDDVRRSVVLETAVRLVFHTVLVFGLYLLFAGHNQSAGTGAAAWLFGGQFLESGKVELDLPVLGVVKATSALPFDVGVFLVVVGLVLAMLRTLGAEAER